MNKAIKFIPSKSLRLVCILIGCIGLNYGAIAQDTSKSILDINNSKIVKKVNALLDTNQKKINKFIFNKADSVKSKLNRSVSNALPKEVEKPLPYERLLNKKYTLGRRAYQNTVAQYNYFFNGQEELNENILKARNQYQDDYTKLLGFYDYDLNDIAKYSIDSIVYRCNANIVLHDLRNNWVDDAYLLMAKAYLFHKDFDTAGSILQFINYSFDEKENGADLPIGSNIRNTKGKFSIATAETNRIWENENVRNESMIWQARNYFETNQINEGLSLLELLKSDAYFPKRLYPFLYEQLAYGYYLSESYENAANYLIKALPNAPDASVKARWYFLIAQMFDKVDQKAAAYPWYQKASQLAINPILGVYAKINMIQYELEKGNANWRVLSESLERLTKKDRYIPYADIIYFEMAKLAIQNKDPMQASDWLIQSVKKNSNSLEQRQKAFELLGSIHYNMDQYAIAKIAYDSLTGVLKTNPNFETIVARKKWMLPISNNQIAMQLEDSLLYIYKQPEEVRKTLFDNWTKRMNTRASELTQLFIADPKKEIAKVYINPLPENNFNKPLNDFYFQNKNSVTNGKQQFVQKWGERPNVDQWRRKTSGTIAYANTSLTKTNTDIIITKDSTKKEQNSISTTILAINDNQDLENSLKKWNEAAIKNAQLFLLELNDFEKALPIYRKIIERDIDPIITERALLDLASQYIHDNQKEKSDAIIQNVIKKYPNGFYVTKQREAITKKQLSSASLDNYKIAYFLSKIGKWDSLAKAHPLISQTVLKTKWNTPYQFIRVKMYAQQRKDSLAIIVLDSIILQNQNELIRERAKNIITELKNRKKTETYLSQLVNIIPVNTTVVEENNITPVEKELAKAEKPILSENQNQVLTNKTGKSSIQFTNDSTEEHYMAMVIKGSKEVFVKEAQTALDNVNEDEFKKLQLDVTYVQFNQDTYIVWVGPFDRQQESIQYAQKIKPRLKTEIISFIPTKQYEIFIFGKSNIVQINNDEDLLQYKDFMLKNIYK
jgi:tetratricopeptide (TPR) repeat protein